MTTWDRTKFIGGSDIAAVMGLHPYKSPLQLWAEKTGKIAPPDLSDVERVEIGAELEEYVARKFEKKTGYRLRRDNRDLKHPLYEYMVVHIDRLVLDGESIFEAKTTSVYMEKHWEGSDIPQHYVLQVMWGMGLAKRDRGFIAVLIGGQRFAWKEIRFDQTLFDAMVEAAKDFWEKYVLADVAPMAIAQDNDTIEELYPVSEKKTVRFEGQDNDEINHLVEERIGGKEQAKLVLAEIDRIEARIKQLLGESEAGETDQYLVSWKTTKRAGYTVKETQFRQIGIKDKNAIKSKAKKVKVITQEKAA